LTKEFTHDSAFHNEKNPAVGAPSFLVPASSSRLKEVLLCAAVRAILLCVDSNAGQLEASRDGPAGEYYETGFEGDRVVAEV
jgi:hypothetical protein